MARSYMSTPEMKAGAILEAVQEWGAAAADSTQLGTRNSPRLQPQPLLSHILPLPPGERGHPAACTQPRHQSCQLVCFGSCEQCSEALSSQPRMVQRSEKLLVGA